MELAGPAHNQFTTVRSSESCLAKQYLYVIDGRQLDNPGERKFIKWLVKETGFILRKVDIGGGWWVIATAGQTYARDQGEHRHQ